MDRESNAWVSKALRQRSLVIGGVLTLLFVAVALLSLVWTPHAVATMLVSPAVGLAAA